MFQKSIVILLSFFLCYHGADSFFLPFLEAIDAVKSTVELGMAAGTAKTPEDALKILYEDRSAEDMLEDLQRSIKDVSNKLDQMESHLSSQMESMQHTLITRLRLTGKLDTAMGKLVELMTAINKYYEEFIQYADLKNGYDNHTVIDFVNSVLSHGHGSISDTVYKMHQIVIPDPKTAKRISTSILQLMQEETQASQKELCGDNLSPQRRIYDLFEGILIAELRAYSVSVFSYRMLSAFKNRKFIVETTKLAKEYDNRLHRYITVVKDAMIHAPRDVRACDPPFHIPRKTHVELEGLYAPYVINERDFNIDGSDSCGNTCDQPHSSITPLGSCYSGSCNTHKHRCQGKITDCKYGGKVMQLCFSNDKVRKYEWLKDMDGGNNYGDTNVACEPDNLKNVYGWLFWGSSCDWCVCTCENDGVTENVINAISTMEQISDTDDNKIVVGVRFALRGQLIAVEIKQGKLGPGGVVTDENWVVTPDVIYDHDIKKFKTVDREHRRLLVEHKDYSLFGKSGVTSVDLDELVAPTDYVLTGVRLAETKPYISAEIRVTKFDYSTGKLTNEHKWLDRLKMRNRAYDRRRTVYKMEFPKDPTKAVNNQLDSDINQSVTITATDRKEDASNHVVPFFDAQDVFLSPPFPLAGLGLGLRASKGYGGFLIWRLINYDLSPHLELPKSLIRDDRQLKG